MNFIPDAVPSEILAPEQEALAAQTISYNSQAMPVAQTNEPTRPCHYSQSCPGFTADELSLGVPGVRQHLWQHHHNDHVRESNGRLICQWKEGTDEACSQTITDLGNLARHMTSVHLRLTVHKCPTCGAQFSRMDALRRHCKKCP